MKLLIVLFALLFCLSAFADDKKYDGKMMTYRQFKKLARGTSWEERSYLSEDGKIRYTANYEVNEKTGKLEFKAKKQYLPAITDGVIIDKTKKSYFSFSPKTMKYLQKVGKGTNPIGWGLLIADIIGEGVDWALDPQNNTITYTGDYEYVCGNVIYSIESEALECGYQNVRRIYKYNEGQEKKWGTTWRGDNLFLNGHTILYYRQKKAKRVMSEQELDEAIRALAKVGNINAKQVILDAGKDEIADGKHDEAIERLADDLSSDDIQDDTSTSSDTNTDDGTATSSNTSDNSSTSGKDKTDTQQQPETATEQETSKSDESLPPFCDWATIICEFIGTKPDMPDEQLPIKDVPLKTPADFDKDYVSFGGQCPADINVEIDLVFAKHTISYSFIPICDFVENYLSIVIIFGAYLFATLHISSAFKI